MKDVAFDDTLIALTVGKFEYDTESWNDCCVITGDFISRNRHQSVVREYCEGSV